MPVNLRYNETVWQANFKDTSGKWVTANFNIAKYGMEEAYQLAHEFLELKEKREFGTNQIMLFDDHAELIIQYNTEKYGYID